MLIEWIVGLYDDRNIDCMLNCEYGGWNEINMIMEWRFESDCEWGYVEFENWDWKMIGISMVVAIESVVIVD